MTDLRITLVQSDLQWQAADRNRAVLETMLEPLAGQSDLVVLPEMFTSAFAVNSGAIAESPAGPTLAWMQAMALQLDAALTGSIAVIENGQQYNRLLFVTPDGKVDHYDKRHLFRMLGEDKRYTAGNRRLIVEWRGWRLLPLVCYDLRFPAWCRYTDAQPYDLMLCVANWPAARDAHWRTLLRARAIENLAWVAGVNRVGRDGNNLDYVGHSAVIDPQGEEILQAGQQAGIWSTTLSMQSLMNWRVKFPAWMDADDFTFDTLDTLGTLDTRIPAPLK